MKTVEDGNGLYTVTHEDSELAEAGWKEPELRYAGPNPDNYVNFNNEKWRIIGLVNVKTTNGIEQRLKIMREDKIENRAWNTIYNNDWTKSTLMQYLNGEYYNDTLNGTSKSMIDESIIWNIGGSKTYTDVTISMFYNRERGIETYNEIPTEWTKENTKNSEGMNTPNLFHSIGLIYPSDYGYATSGGNLANRNKCLQEKQLTKWNAKNEGSYTYCKDNDWIYNSMPNHTSSWLILKSADSTTSVRRIMKRPTTGYDGVIENNSILYSQNVYPTLYLKSNVKITDGTGEQGNPYILSVD